jgi:hypothetical protein
MNSSILLFKVCAASRRLVTPRDVVTRRPAKIEGYMLRHDCERLCPGEISTIHRQPFDSPMRNIVIESCRRTH